MTSDAMNNEDRRRRLTESIELLDELGKQESKQCALLAEAHRFPEALKCHEDAKAFEKMAEMFRFKLAR